MLFWSYPIIVYESDWLKVINLGRNQLQGPISNAFANFKSLETLSLYVNNFGGRVDLDTFVGLKTLKSLYLDQNRISFVTSNNYTNDTLPKLRYLGLSSCNLKDVPDFLRFQHKLITLYLHDNKIHGLVPVWIWNNSRETLQMFGLSYNFITGFDQHFFRLPWVRLELFDISYNQLRGQPPIPPQTTVVYDVSNNNCQENYHH